MIFAFLRALRATLIPSITVPVALVGTFGVMYELGYSLDNLSLMALRSPSASWSTTPSSCSRTSSATWRRGIADAGGVEGAGEIGFTILSISLSLVAVFIPLLLMGGLVGRLFREFSVTVAMTIAVSAVVSLTLTPMMCGASDAGRPTSGMAASTGCRSGPSTGLLAGYGARSTSRCATTA